MTTLLLTYFIRSVVSFTETETVGAAGPAELHPTLTDHAKFVICDHTIEQDHRGVKRVTRPMLGFKSFMAAQDTLVGIELMHMIKKRQLVVEEGDEGLTAAELFYSLAA
jgi:transposase-like protein